MYLNVKHMFNMCGPKHVIKVDQYAVLNGVNHDVFAVK